MCRTSACGSWPLYYIAQGVVLPPLDHGSLLGEVRRVRASEVSQCQVQSEVREAAVARLVKYGGHGGQAYENGRFLDLKDVSAQAGHGRGEGG